jgi:hypothetical protein
MCAHKTKSKIAEVRLRSVIAALEVLHVQDVVAQVRYDTMCALGL